MFKGDRQPSCLVKRFHNLILMIRVYLQMKIVRVYHQKAWIRNQKIISVLSMLQKKSQLVAPQYISNLYIVQRQACFYSTTMMPNNYIIDVWRLSMAQTQRYGSKLRIHRLRLTDRQTTCTITCGAPHNYLWETIKDNIEDFTQVHDTHTYIHSLTLVCLTK